MSDASSVILSEDFAPELRVAMAYCAAEKREMIAAYFGLDRRMAQIIAKASEPMLAQMRLAWWREMLGKPVKDRPAGDAVLDAIGQHWAQREEMLISAIDAWEQFLKPEPFVPADVAEIATGRSAPFAAFAAPDDATVGERLRQAGQYWVAADTHIRLSDDDEREACRAYALRLQDSNAAIPKPLRGIAVLEALAKRAIRRGGAPMMAGKGAALLALRVGLIGR